MIDCDVDLTVHVQWTMDIVTMDDDTVYVLLLHVLCLSDACMLLCAVDADRMML